MILRNLYYSDLRSNRRERSLDELNLDSYATAPAQFAHLEFDAFRQAFNTLPAEQREALVLVGASGFSYAAAATVCNSAIGTIKSRVSRARSELRRLLGDQGLDEITPGSAPSASIGTD